MDGFWMNDGSRRVASRRARARRSARAEARNVRGQRLEPKFLSFKNLLVVADYFGKLDVFREIREKLFQNIRRDIVAVDELPFGVVGLDSQLKTSLVKLFITHRHESFVRY